MTPNENSRMVVSALARHMLNHPGDLDGMIYALSSPEFTKNNGLGWLRPHVEKGLATSIGGQNGFLVDAGPGYLKSLSNSWFDSVQMTVAPINTPLMVGSTQVAGQIAESQKIPVLAGMDKFELTPKKTGGLAVLSREAAVVEPLVRRALDDGVIKNTNRATIQELEIESSKTVQSSGSTLAALLADAREATSEFEFDSRSTIVALASPRNVARISMLTDSSGALACPNVGIRGGEIAPDFRVISCPGAFVEPDSNGDKIILIDPAGLLVDRGNLFLSSSDDVTLEMIDPDGGTTDLVSLFATNDLGLKFVRTFALEPIRDCVAVIEGLEL